MKTKPKAKTRPKLKAAPPDEARIEVVWRAEFPVRYTRDVLAPQNPDLADVLRRREPLRRQRALFLIDSGVAAVRPQTVERAAAYAAAYKAHLALAAPPVVVEGGAACKTRPELRDWLRARLTGAGLERDAHLVVIGGGALLDAAGFVAATLHGGVRVTRVPTTLTSQAGGALSLSCGLNALGRRDWVGTTLAPWGVLVDPKWLASLPDRERRAGAIEILSTALARDARLFDWLCARAEAFASFDRRVLEPAARWSARLHWEELAQQESLCRAPDTDLGRWAADAAAESAVDGLHESEAAALGLAVDVLLSVVLTGLPPASGRAALELLASLGAPLWNEVLGEADDDGAPALLDGLARSAQRNGAGSGVPLLRAIGHAEECGAVNAEAVAAAVEALRRWGAGEG